MLTDSFNDARNVKVVRLRVDEHYLMAGSFEHAGGVEQRHVGQRDVAGVVTEGPAIRGIRHAHAAGIIPFHVHAGRTRRL